MSISLYVIFLKEWVRDDEDMFFKEKKNFMT